LLPFDAIAEERAFYVAKGEVAVGEDRFAAGRLVTLRRGEPIGRVGMTGRATGPHLCWRLKWRDRNLDTSLLICSRPPERLA
jgi:hypothetical protein